MNVIIQPPQQERTAATAEWSTRLHALPLDAPDLWTGETYQAFAELIREAFTTLSMTRLDAFVDRTEPALVKHYQWLSHQRLFPLRKFVQGSGWDYQTTDRQVLHVEWIRWPPGKEPTDA